MKMKEMIVKGTGIVGILTGAYLVLPWVTNNNSWNTILGWVLGALAVGLLIIDGFGKGWKDKSKIALGIVGILTAFYLVPSWVPNQPVVNMGFGVLLIIFGALSFT